MTLHGKKIDKLVKRKTSVFQNTQKDKTQLQNNILGDTFREKRLSTRKINFGTFHYSGVNNL